ncbi:spore photoproduct lyase family protein [Candidatus Borrarchaeum sp.]|uniref:spore photoproduct lyase family protein n=1 Tax=Candidatus Borrarchaeum sp. TaxID=2846742 RepID=UPI00257FCFD9|nr:hypothetical protein [Candidatus Borrarchaeum sp.]
MAKLIEFFDKTPEGIVCPHFWMLKFARGCRYGCSYCYLALTYRIQGVKPHLYSWNQLKDDFCNFCEKVEYPTLLNAGELTDSFLMENTDNPFSTFIVPLFESQNVHKILFLTKSNNLRNFRFLFEQGNVTQTILSWSVNIPKVAHQWEKGAPSPIRRIHAFGNATYCIPGSTRIRIDPMLPVENWKTKYEDLLKNIFDFGFPERITLGTLRYFPSLPSRLKKLERDTSLFDLFPAERCAEDGRYRLTDREEIYRHMIRLLEEKFGYSRYALCKETQDVWDNLGLDSKRCLCNCQL